MSYIYFWRYMAPSIDPYEVINVQGLYPYTDQQVNEFKNSNKIKRFSKDNVLYPNDVIFSKMIKAKELINVDSKFFVHFRHDVIDDFSD